MQAGEKEVGDSLRNWVGDGLVQFAVISNTKLTF